jgi:uncharacterized protein with HEPN domain
MRPKIGDQQRLQHILDAIRAIQNFVSGLRAETFFENELIQSGTVYQLQIIGEAAARLTDETKSEAPSTDWQGIIGLRNIIAHQYWGVDFVQIWNIVKIELPELKRTVEDLITRSRQSTEH